MNSASRMFETRIFGLAARGLFCSLLVLGLPSPGLGAEIEIDEEQAAIVGAEHAHVLAPVDRVGVLRIGHQPVHTAAGVLVRLVLDDDGDAVPVRRRVGRLPAFTCATTPVAQV